MTHPRCYVGRSPKLKKMYTGPFMVIKEIGPVNVVIQQSRRSKPLVVHVDKLKPCLAETPPSWLTDDNVESEEKSSDDGPDPEEFAELLGLVDAEVTEPDFWRGGGRDSGSRFRGTMGEGVVAS